MDGLKFIDFCSGIGGGRLGLEKSGLKCVGHSEIDDSALNTYQLFFNDNNNYGNLMEIDTSDLPDFDLMIAGFPCQTFSIVGKRAGFEDYRGMVIHGLIKILKEKDVKYFIFENVKGLINHDKGNTIKIILELLDEAGYHVEHKLLNSLDYGVPQMRERVYFVGIRKDLHKSKFKWPKKQESLDIKEFLADECSPDFDINNPTFIKYLNNKYNKGKYDIEDILKSEYSVIDWRQSDLRIYDSKCPTLRTGRHGLLYVRDGKLKKISGFEALLLQGFPIEIASLVKQEKIADNKLLSQAGNAMTVNVINAISEALRGCIDG